MESAELANGESFPFSAWPRTPVPKGPPGVYTIWRGSDFLYVGISWKEPTAAGKPTKGLWGRLDFHASGRRSGNQFCLYVCDRFVLCDLGVEEIRKVAAGALSLDRLTKEFIRAHLSFRFVTTATGTEARQMEGLIRRDGLPEIGRPFLNPLGPQ